MHEQDINLDCLLSFHVQAKQQGIIHAHTYGLLGRNTVSLT